MAAMNGGTLVKTLPFSRLRYTQSRRVSLPLVSRVAVGNTTTKEAFALNGGSVNVRGNPL